MNRKDVWLLVEPGVVFLLGLIAFFGRVSITEFFVADSLREMPEGAHVFEQKVRIVGWVGAGLSIIGLLMVSGTVWRNLRKDDKKEDNKKE